jgi:predicted CDP-diglyceride synthetase/phosphatidate cytidylyltransferase
LILQNCWLCLQVSFWDWSAAVLVIIYILFFLSVMAPMKSERKFWRVIHKIREGMDLTVYCFFYICAILTILYVVWMVVHGWIEAYF